MQNQKTSKNIPMLFLFISFCVGMGLLGGSVTIDQIKTWYVTLNKPTWTPPNYLFGPVWTTLYVMMATAAWMIWKEGGFRKQKLPLSLFLIQFFFNFLWSFFFFQFHLIGVAFLDIILLEITLLATMICFWKVNPLAGKLLIAYVLWVAYAASLNFAIIRLN